MTRGKIIYLDSDQKAYSTIEFNGDMYPEGHGDEILERFEENYFTSFTVYENFVFRFNKRNFGYPEKLIHSLSCSQTGVIDVTGNWTDYLYIINESTQKWIILDEEGTKDLPDQTLGVVSFKSVENVIQKKLESVSDQTKVLDNIARNYENVKEEVKKIVGGEILEHEGKTIYNEGKEEGHIEGKADGEALVSKLMSILFKENKIEDAKKAAEDSNYLHLLLKQYNIE